MKNKEQRRREAAERQAKRDARTPAQQLEFLKNRMGDSKKETIKLQKQIETASQKKAPLKAKETEKDTEE